MRRQIRIDRITCIENSVGYPVGVEHQECRNDGGQQNEETVEDVILDFGHFGGIGSCGAIGATTPGLWQDSIWQKAGTYQAIAKLP